MIFDHISIRFSARTDVSSTVSRTKHAYNRAADLWQTWLPPKAIDSLRKGI